MAVTQYKPKQYTYQPIQNSAPAGQQASTENQQIRGVSDQTRQKQAQYQQGYTPSQTVTDAQARLQDVMNQKPQGYISKYGAALDNILQEIQNPKDFKYSFNDDEMFKYYADLYTQKGRQASADAMGQAAALTGGYGNSYGQAVGNQAYQQYLLNLYDRGMDLRNQAYQQYQDQRADQYNQLGALQGADQTDYGRYRDTVGDWENERNYYTDRADTEYNRDYNDFINNRDYWTQQAQAENADWWNANQFNETMRQNDANRQLNYDQMNADNQYRYDTLNEQQAQYLDSSMLNWSKLEEDQRQFDANLSEEQRQYNQNQARAYVNAILATNQLPSNELLVAAGLSREDAQKLITQALPAVAAGPTGPGNTTPPPADDKGNGDKERTWFDDLVDWTNNTTSNISKTANSLPQNIANTIGNIVDKSKTQDWLNQAFDIVNKKAGKVYTGR